MKSRRRQEAEHQAEVTAQLVTAAAGAPVDLTRMVVSWDALALGKDRDTALARYDAGARPSTRERAARS